MSLLVNAAAPLARIPVPRLPQAPQVYDPVQIAQLTNVLNLYFNQVNNLLVQLSTKAVTYTVATLPSAVTSGSGARAFVSDASAPTFGSTVAGGGAVATPVYSDGTNWKVG
jgi:hypothetical protein